MIKPTRFTNFSNSFLE